MVNHFYFTEFIFGDPHFKTVDNKNFTFNGVGEYVLVDTPPALGFKVQARLQPFSSNTTGTVISAIGVKQGDIPTVQVSAENGQIQLHVGGDQHELSVGDSPLIVGASGVVSTDLAGGIPDGAMGMDEEQVSVRMEDTGSIVVSTGEEASIGISLQNGFLGISVSLPQNFMSMTSGFLGNFNGDPDDDFMDRSGNVVLSSSSEQEIYTQFGLQCKLDIHYGTTKDDRTSG